VSAWVRSAARRLRRLLPAIPRTPTHRLGHRNVYILPTASGAVFAALLLVLLVASINYRLGLGYALTFLLAGAGLASVGMTHANLRGLTLALRPPGAGFAGAPLDVELRVENPGRARHGVALRWRGDTAPPVWTDLPAGDTTLVGLRFAPPARGWQDLPPLVVETRFPFGFLRAWTVWQPAAQVLAWPRPEPAPPPLPHQPGDGGEPGRTAPRGEPDPGFTGLRPWRAGDAPRAVAWRHWARHGGAGLLSRDTASAAGPALWLDGQDAGPASMGVELRLSRLAAWVEQAHAQALACGLRLPGCRVEPAAGEAQRRRLLEALALWR
jgi:uncharacterized protein (DUF58 family)